MLGSRVNNLAFCTLAMTPRYCGLAARFAASVQEFMPGTMVVILTDHPLFFRGLENCISVPHRQQGIRHCFHDKRLVLEQTLRQFETAILVDADSRLTDPLPTAIDWLPGLTSGNTNAILAHGANRKDLSLQRILAYGATDLGVTLDEAYFVHESLLVVRRDRDRELEFLQRWGRLARYLELRGVYAGEGNAIGLAAAAVGWCPQRQGWDALKGAVEHCYASRSPEPKSWQHKLRRGLGFSYRWSRESLMALGDPRFYYGAP